MIFKHGAVKIVIKEKKYEQENPNADIFIAGRFFTTIEPKTMVDLSGAFMKVIDYFNDAYREEQMKDHIAKTIAEQQRRDGLWYWRLRTHLTKYGHLLYTRFIWKKTQK